MRILVAGGGVAALETLLALRMVGGSRISIELLAPDPGFTDRPGSVATAFGFGAAAPLRLEDIARGEGVALRRGALAAVDPDRRRAASDDGQELGYDALVVATGALARPAIPGAVTFSGPGDVAALERLIARAAAGALHRLAFVLPSGVAWSLPLYELAIMAAVELRDQVVRDARITVVTPEQQPLWLFGPAAATALEGLLSDRGIALRTHARAIAVVEDELLLAGGDTVAADAVVALPVLAGPRIPGLPADDNGFIPVNAHGRVAGLEGVYAAGDATAFPVKQGGLATQQADAVADSIGAAAGAVQRPAPFRPVLRGLLLTGGAPLYLRAELSAHGDVLRTHRATFAGPRGETSTHALWWPPAKVAGRYLGPYLASGRPRALGSEPLRDRTPAAAATAGSEDAFALALLVAEEDARLGDFGQAVHALDAAAFLRGGSCRTSSRPSERHGPSRRRVSARRGRRRAAQPCERVLVRPGALPRLGCPGVRPSAGTSRKVAALERAEPPADGCEVVAEAGDRLPERRRHLATLRLARGAFAQHGENHLDPARAVLQPGALEGGLEGLAALHGQSIFARPLRAQP
jgi:sulfide:quinone oxidoreductase